MNLVVFRKRINNLLTHWGLVMLKCVSEVDQVIAYYLYDAKPLPEAMQPWQLYP